MCAELAESVDQALIAEDYDDLKDVVSRVSDWKTESQETVDYVLQRIGMYGFSGRTNRYQDIAEEIVDEGGSPSLLTCALLEFNGRAIKLLNNSPALIRSVDDHGNSALHNAAVRGNLELASLLCEEGADVNLLNGDSEAPIHLAAHAGPWKPKPARDVINLLLSYGATTSLHILATIGDHQAIRDLVEQQQVDVDLLDSAERTALFHAAHNNHLHTVHLLLEMGADPNLSDKDGQTPLSTACLHMLSQECDQKVIDGLLAHGATRSLESAIVLEDLLLISELIENDPARLKDQDHVSALGYAIHVWRPKSLRHLLKLGARPNAENWAHIERIAQNPQLVEQFRTLVN